MINGFTSNSFRMMERSVDFLWAKQAAHLDNIANAETPGYKVKTVTFEEQFRQKLQAVGRNGIYSKQQIRDVIENSDWTVREDDESTRMDENGVNVLEQLVEAVRTGYQMQYLYQAMRSDMATLGKAISGG